MKPLNHFLVYSFLFLLAIACETDQDPIDPVEIDEYFFCETCANNYVALRIDGYLDKVSDKTNKLVWDGYYDVYDAINFPK